MNFVIIKTLFMFYCLIIIFVWKWGLESSHKSQGGGRVVNLEKKV